MSKGIKKAISFAAPIAGSFIPGVGTAVGAAIGGGLGSLATGGSLKDAIISAGGSYVGNSLGSKFGGSLGTFGDAAKNVGVNLGQSVAGDSIGQAIGNFAPGLASNVANTSIASVIGSMYGGSAAKNAFSTPEMPKAANTNTQPVIEPFKPQREAEQDMPTSFVGVGSLNPMQTSTNIANQGVYGGGAGPQEESYFLNQVNRRLVDDAGAVDADFNDIAPIEQSYLQQLGLGGFDNTTSLLEAITRRRAA